jgi:hypothetical protein
MYCELLLKCDEGKFIYCWNFYSEGPGSLIFAYGLFRKPNCHSIFQIFNFSNFQLPNFLKLKLIIWIEFILVLVQNVVLPKHFFTFFVKVEFGQCFNKCHFLYLVLKILILNLTTNAFIQYIITKTLQCTNITYI